MSNGEREMVLTVEKIFNWQPPTDAAHFQLAFYSLKSSALILERTIAAAPAKAEMLFNYSLRITYLADENEVLPRTRRSSSDSPTCPPAKKRYYSASSCSTWTRSVRGRCSSSPSAATTEC
jgi:hypothetical protein